MLLAGVVMAEVMWAVGRLLGSNVGLGALVRVCCAGLAGLVAYVGVLTVLRVAELEQVRTRLRARVGRPA
jgi:hypothetical protein